MFCSNCGKKLQDGWTVCPNCGQPVEQTSPEQISESGQSQNIEYNTQTFDYIQSDLQNGHNDRESKKVTETTSLTGYQKFRFWSAMVCGIIVAVVFFIMGQYLAGAVMMLAAVLFCPLILGKFSGWKRAIFICFAILAAGLSAEIYYASNGKKDEASDKVTTKQSEVSEDQTEMITDASEDLSTDTSTDAQVTEKNSSENTSEAQTAYSADMVIDSDMSAQVETVNYTGVYYLPYINYDGAACDEVNKRIEKLAQKYIENTDEYGSGCMGISYKWTLYGNILSLIIPLQFDADMVEYNVYVLDLKNDKLLTKKDLLAELNIDEADYEQDAQDTMDACFYSLYGSFKDTDDYYDVVYNETIASENVAEALPYIDENGTLGAVAKIYSMAGANYYYHMVTVLALDGACEYSGESDNYNSKVLANTDNQSGSQETGDTSDSEYMLPNSDSEYISDSDLDGLTPDECRLALNEIYARHGRKFNDPDYQAYFNSKSWYNGTIDPDDFDDTAMFNQYELANRDYIIDYEKRMGYR